MVLSIRVFSDRKRPLAATFKDRGRGRARLGNGSGPTWVAAARSLTFRSGPRPVALDLLTL